MSALLHIDKTPTDFAVGLTLGAAGTQLQLVHLRVPSARLPLQPLNEAARSAPAFGSLAGYMAQVEEFGSNHFVRIVSLAHAAHPLHVLKYAFVPANSDIAATLEAAHAAKCGLTLSDLMAYDAAVQWPGMYCNVRLGGAERLAAVHRHNNFQILLGNGIKLHVNRWLWTMSRLVQDTPKHVHHVAAPRCRVRPENATLFADMAAGHVSAACVKCTATEILASPNTLYDLLRIVHELEIDTFKPLVCLCRGVQLAMAAFAGPHKRSEHLWSVLSPLYANVSGLEALVNTVHKSMGKHKSPTIRMVLQTLQYAVLLVNMVPKPEELRPAAAAAQWLFGGNVRNRSLSAAAAAQPILAAVPRNVRYSTTDITGTGAPVRLLRVRSAEGSGLRLTFLQLPGARWAVQLYGGVGVRAVAVGPQRVSSAHFDADECGIRVAVADQTETYLLASSLERIVGSRLKLEQARRLASTLAAGGPPLTVAALPTFNQTDISDEKLGDLFDTWFQVVEGIAVHTFGALWPEPGAFAEALKLRLQHIRDTPGTQPAVARAAIKRYVAALHGRVGLTAADASDPALVLWTWMLETARVAAGKFSPIVLQTWCANLRAAAAGAAQCPPAQAQAQAHTLPQMDEFMDQLTTALWTAGPSIDGTPAEALELVALWRFLVTAAALRAGPQ